MEPTSVLITTEGTYPCYSGGVSVWCDYLIRELANVDFHIFALTHTPSQPFRFTLPANVQSCNLHPIWGTEEPGIATKDFASALERKLRTTEQQIQTAFLPAFEAALREILSENPQSESLGRALLALHLYCRDFDYAGSARSAQAWEVFVRLAGASGLDLSLDDATNCMRWLIRNLSVVSASFPEVELVHASIATTGGIPGAICKLRSGSAYLLSEHGLHLRELYLSLSRCTYSAPCRAFLLRFYGALTRLSYHFADRITSLGEFNKRWQIRLGADAAKIEIAPNGVEAHRFYPLVPAAQRHRPVVLTMARIAPIKGIDTLIRAAAIVRDRFPETTFRILGEVGDNAFHAECTSLVESLRLQHHVEFGCAKDVAEAYRHADIFCLPSRSEAMPFAVIEAMLSGCPVVASDVGCVAGMLGEHGLVVKPNHPEGLASALMKMLATPKEVLKRQAAAARERALERFTIESFGGQFRAAYGDLKNATSGLSRTAA